MQFTNGGLRCAVFVLDARNVSCHVREVIALLCTMDRKTLGAASSNPKSKKEEK